ncbi:glycoside hydrolase family 28 protein [Backusella circina FSU 941]|nr:glycoside hydrolase family 28 protein [Backusella circina FSU 941]
MKSTLFLAGLLFIKSTFGLDCVVQHNGQDDTSNIMNAFTQCQSGGRVIFSQGLNYQLGDTIITPSLSNVEIMFEENSRLVYPFNENYLNTVPLPGAVQNVSSFFTIRGQNVKVNGGEIDGSGSNYWVMNPLPSNRPVMMTFMVDGLDVRNQRLVNSPNWNYYVFQSKNVVFDNIYIDEDSSQVPHNTDGWDLSNSQNIQITNSYINNGDDCVSIKTNTSDILIQNLYCNGSHGISVGSLGNIPDQPDYVTNLFVQNVTCDNCQNGARIKTWPNGALGAVKNVKFTDFRVTNSDNPVIIDQCYQTKDLTQCAQNPGKISIDGVTFLNITGGGSVKAKQKMVYVVCSAEAPCNDFHFEEIDLKPYNPSLAPQYQCAYILNNATAGLACNNY